MKCPKCGGKGKVNGLYFDTQKSCKICNGTGIIESMTNDEWRKTCSAEEFADWLTDTFDLCGAGCSNCFVKELCFDEHNNKMPNDLIVVWLKQPHTKE